MGEGADIVLGDAWVKNMKNGTLVITRSNTGTNLISKVHSENLIKLYFIKESEIVRMHWHNLKFKKYGLSPFLNLLHFILSTKLAINLAPVKFFTLLSRFRRKFAIGISVDLQTVNKNDLVINPK
tara:strand:- start:189 stop:563 length:375 start_codon:yes stop_codon:yes gene_type:complete